LPPDFQWFLFSLGEQRALLTAALRKLNAAESRQVRRRRKEYACTAPIDGGSSLDLFLPDELYGFQEGHYDGVIRRYRETHVSSWPDNVEGLSGTLDHRGIYPSPDVQTHLLHLASDGEIL
ncbi:hypothetical protein C8Q72DRAFT_767050, partial [Fomitopsis betulina]